MAFYSNTVGSVGRFARAYLDVFREGVSGQYPRLALAWLMAAVSAGCQGLVIAAIAGAGHFVDARGLGSGSQEMMAEWRPWLLEFIPAAMTSEYGVLYAAVVLATALLLISTTARFLGATIERRIARIYHQRLVQGLMDRAVSAQSIDFYGKEGVAGLRLAALQYAIHMSKACEALVRVPQAIVFFLFFYAATFALMWEASAVLSAMALILLPAAFVVSRRIHSAAEDFFGAAAGTFSGWIATLLMSFDSFYLHNGRARQSGQKLLELPVARRYFDGYDDLQLASERMGYVTGMARSLLFGVTLVSIITLVMLKEVSVSLVIAYASALIIAFGYLRTLFTYLATLNIFYPQVVKFRALAAAWQDAKPKRMSEDDGLRGATLTLENVPTRSIPGAVCSAEMAGGTVVDLISPVSVGKFNPTYWLRPLAVARDADFQPDEICLFNASPIDLAPATLAELDHSFRQRTGRTLFDLSTELGVGQQFQDWVSARPTECVLDHKLFYEMNFSVRCLLYVGAALESGAPFVFLESRILEQFNQNARDRLRNFFTDRILFVWRGLVQKPPLRGDFSILLKGESIFAIVPGAIDEDLLAKLYPRTSTNLNESPEILSLLQ